MRCVLRQACPERGWRGEARLALIEIVMSLSRLNLLPNRGIKDEYEKTTFSLAIGRGSIGLSWTSGLHAE